MIISTLSDESPGRSTSVDFDLDNLIFEYVSESKSCALIIDVYKHDSSRLTLQDTSEQSAYIRRLLGDNKYSNFEVPDEFYLTGSEATFKNIQIALSKIFRQENSYNTIFVYFKSFWFINSPEETYLGSYDIDENDPFVSGLSLKNLLEIISSSKSNKKKIILILDCCFYENSKFNVKSINSVFSQSLRDLSNSNIIVFGLVEDNNHLNENRSSNASNESNRIRCGDVSISIAEILRAGGDDFGIITAHQMRTLFQKRLKDKIHFYPEDFQQSEDFKILISEEYERKVLDIVKGISKITHDILNPFVYRDRFLFIIKDHITNLKKLKMLEPDNVRINQIILNLQTRLNGYFKIIDSKVKEFLYITGGIYAKRIDNINENFFSEIEKSIAYLNFDQITNLSIYQLAQLNHLIRLLTETLEFDDFLDRITPTRSITGGIMSPHHKYGVKW